jgi:tetratricopeptide (TPR) repeat protein
LSSFKDLAGVMGRAAIIGMIMVMTVVTSPPPGWAAPTTQAMIAEVQAALDKGDAQHAANLADSALKEGVSAGERGRLLLYRGLAQELLGASAEAMRDFTQALNTTALPPDERAQALLQRGFLRDGLGRLDEAAADYTAVIALKEGSQATALNNRANIYRRQNRLTEARRDYLAALSAQGGKPQYSWYGLGQIAEAQHDTPAARGFYAKATAADAGYGLASERLAALGGPPDGAIADPAAVVLHPPLAAAEKSGFKVAANESDGTIVLRAPRSRAKDAAVALHRPSAPAKALPAPAARARLALRPALDQPARPGKTAGDEVQLGAWRSEEEANTGWGKAKARADGTLDGLNPHVVTADLPGKGRYYRLRVAPGAGHNRAELCAALTAKGLACLLARD